MFHIHNKLAISETTGVAKFTASTFAFVCLSALFPLDHQHTSAVLLHLFVTFVALWPVVIKLVIPWPVVIKLVALIRGQL